jgi:hypothetical protein
VSGQDAVISGWDKQCPPQFLETNVSCFIKNKVVPWARLSNYLWRVLLFSLSSQKPALVFPSACILESWASPVIRETKCLPFMHEGTWSACHGCMWLSEQCAVLTLLISEPHHRDEQPGCGSSQVGGVGSRRPLVCDS